MKNILRVLLALTISFSIIMFYGSHSSEKSTFNRSVKVLAQLPPIAQNLAHHLFPTDDGYIDRTGKVIFKLPLGSGNGGAFSDGLAAITFKSGLIGYIDRSGKVVILPKFRDSQELDGAENFSEGLAAFTSPLVDSQGRDVFGYIDKSGKIAIPAKFVKVGNFHSGVALVIFTNNVNRYAFINKQGEILFENSKLFEIIDHSEFSEGLAAVIKDDKWGFIDVNGTFVIPPKFTNVFKDTKFNEGLVPIKTQTTYSYECGSNPVRTQIGYRDKYGFMDRTGKFEIEPKFDGAEPFSEGLAAVRIYDGSIVKWGYVDRTGSFVIPPKFVEPTSGVGAFSEGLASVNIPDPQSNNGKTGYIDRTGNFVIPPQFTQGAGIFHGGLAYVTTVLIGASDPQIKLSDGSSMHSKIKYGFIDRQGKFVWEKIRTVGR